MSRRRPSRRERRRLPSNSSWLPADASSSSKSSPSSSSSFSSSSSQPPPLLSPRSLRFPTQTTPRRARLKNRARSNRLDLRRATSPARFFLLLANLHRLPPHHHQASSRFPYLPLFQLVQKARRSRSNSLENGRPRWKRRYRAKSPRHRLHRPPSNSRRRPVFNHNNENNNKE